MKDKEKNFVSATVYLYNSEEEIERFGRLLIQTFEDNFEHSEIIFVNDNSTDNSAEIVKRLSSIASTTSLSLLNMSYFQGRETAMNAGLDMTIGDFVFEFDSTFIDYTGQEIMNVYAHALGGFDIVSASPDKNKRRTSGIFYCVFDKFSETPYHMCSERFRILSRRVINRVTSMNNKIPYRKAVYSQCGLETKNIVYSAVMFDKKQSHIIDRVEKRYRRKLAIDVLLLFTQLGYRFSIGMTTMMIFTTLFMIGYSFTVYLFGNPVEGWTTTILFLSFAFFGLFGLITIIIKYLQIMVDLVFRRKQYYFESLEKLTK
ncbi:MAG: glycosyltransferase [Lachnospiraceae bacterium]|nr:glycosyltransferase [Lachnospiraceae bacterium]